MERLRNTLASTNSLASANQSLGSGARLPSSPTQRDAQDKADKSKVQRHKTHAKERQPRERKPRQQKGGARGGTT